jgi:hypothetical protein
VKIKAKEKDKMDYIVETGLILEKLNREPSPSGIGNPAYSGSKAIKEVNTMSEQEVEDFVNELKEKDRLRVIDDKKPIKTPRSRLSQIFSKNKQDRIFVDYDVIAKLPDQKIKLKNDEIQSFVDTMQEWGVQLDQIQFMGGMDED